MNRRTPLVASCAAGVLVAAGLVAVTMPASAASTGCSVTYVVQSQWPGGFTGTVSITNLGTAVTSWTLAFDFPTAGQSVTQGWSATWSQTGTHVSAASMAWNGALGTNASTSIGFTGTWSGTNPVPAAFTVNGTACAAPGTSPSAPSPTPSRSAGPSPTASMVVSPTPSRSASPTPTGTGTGGSAPALHVSGNQLLTASGTPYRLLGVNRSSGEYSCVQGKGMWDGGPVDQASVDAMKTWNIHAVRIPLNEECWIGTSDVPAGQPSGATYQQNVKDYVNLLVANGITPIIDLHWTYGQYTGTGAGCSDTAATCQKPMPDTQYSPTFWTGVANAFKGNNAVVFDLFNEPYPDAATGYVITTEWTCWRDGGTCPGIGYPVAGMQTLVNAVRATGATNVIMLGGVAWSNDLSQWLAYKPSDPTGNLMAAWHTYNFNACSSTYCWDNQVAPVAAQVPVQAGEIGQNSCAHDYIDQVMTWADTHGIGYTAWTWNPWGCGSGNVLITDYNGTPTSTYGEGYKAHLLSENP